MNRSKGKKPVSHKFDFHLLKERATSPDRAVRKAAFVEYYEQFREFPSYLFDNEREIDENLWQTAQDILKDKDTTKEMRDGVDMLLNRLPFRIEARS